MRSQSVVTGVIGLLVVTAVAGAIFFSTKKNHLELKGEVLKVRSQQSDPEHTIALIDVRVNNPSTQQFVVRDVEILVDEPDGKSTPAETVTEMDAQRLVDYYKTLGTKYNRGLLRKDKIEPGATSDRTLTISAPMSDERFAARKRLRILVSDIDGAVREFAERR